MKVRWRPAAGFAARAIVLVVLATLPWLLWLAWPVTNARSPDAEPPLAAASERLESLATAIAGWEADATAVAADPLVTAALAVGDDGGLSDLLANHETASRYANALVVDADYRVRAFARPTRWAGLRVPRAGDPLARVLESSRIADGAALSPLAAAGSATVLYVAAPLRDGDRRLGTLVLVAGPGQFAALLDSDSASGITHELLVAIDGAWHRLEAAGGGDARLSRRPADPELERLLLQATTGAEASGLLADSGGAAAAVVARSFAPLNAVVVVARGHGLPAGQVTGVVRPSVLWPLAGAIAPALLLAFLGSGRGPEPGATARRPRRREPRLSPGAPDGGTRAASAPAREALIATLGPELRAPLAAILGTAELAAPEATEPRLAVRIERVRTSAGAMLGYLDDLALLAGLEAGSAPARSEPFRLRDALADVAARCAAEVAASGNELLFRRGPGVPDALLGDRERLADALSRLVKATAQRLPAGRPLRIDFEVPREADAADRPKDEAVDPAPVLVATIHAADALLAGDDPLDGATAVDGRDGAFPGTAAIGIAIAARSAESMGTECLWAADSDPPAFRFELPLATTPDGEQARPSMRGRRALVVDELGVSAEVLAEQLARAGLDVHEAPTLAAATAEIRRSVPPRAKPYDVLLVDDRVPDLDRLTALVEGRREGRALPPVLLLGTPGRASTAIADARVDRPFDEPTVLDAIAGALGLAPATPSCPTEAETLPAPDRALAGRRLLLVDDNAINREVGVELLQRAGAAVDTAADGRAAVDVLAAGRAYDAVLMDLEMPRMGGLDATRAIRALPGRAGLPIIAWTAHALPEDRARCLAAGMSDYLPKPVAPDRLYATVARWTGGGAAHDVEPDADPSERPEAKDLPPLDAMAAIRFLGDDAPLYRRLLATFTAEHTDDATRIRAAIAAGRRAEAREATHALKGLAATLGMAPLARVTASIELSLRAGSAVPDAVLDALRERLTDALAAAGAWLEQHAPARRSPADDDMPDVDRDAQWSLLDAQIARGELGALGTFESLAASRPGELDDVEWEAVRDALAQLDFERAAALRRRLG